MPSRETAPQLERDLRALAAVRDDVETHRERLRLALLQRAATMPAAPFTTEERKGFALRDRRGLAGVFRLPKRSLALAVVLLVTLAGTGYATQPIISQLFARSPQTNEPLGEALTLSETSNGYTMTLERAYADRQVILLAYTITSSTGDAVNGAQAVGGPTIVTDPRVPSYPILTTDDGRQIPLLGGGGYGSLHSVATIETYSGAAIPPTAGRITLHLQANAMEIPQADHNMAVVPGHWSFTVTVPVAPSRIAELNQTVTDGKGWGVTLERVAITPTEVAVVLRGAGTEAHVQLVAGDKQYVLPAPGGYDGGDAAVGQEMKQCFQEKRRCPELWKTVDATYGASADIQDGRTGSAVGWAKELQDQHGPWKLIVTAPPTAGALSQPQGGPWVFHFTMP